MTESAAARRERQIEDRRLAAQAHLRQDQPPAGSNAPTDLSERDTEKAWQQARRRAGEGMS